MNVGKMFLDTKNCRSCYPWRLHSFYSVTRAWRSTCDSVEIETIHQDSYALSLLAYPCLQLTRITASYSPVGRLFLLVSSLVKSNSSSSSIFSPNANFSIVSNPGQCFPLSKY